MMFDIAMYYPDVPYVEEGLAVETIESVSLYKGGKKRYIIAVSCDGVVLADAFTHAPNPADEQILLDLVRVRGEP